MSDSVYLRAVEETLAQIEATLEQAGIDADCALSGMVLNIVLEGGGKIVVNAQAPLHQLWLASRAGGLHFALEDGGWRDTRTGMEFYEALSRAVTDLIGRPVQLRAA